MKVQSFLYVCLLAVGLLSGVSSAGVRGEDYYRAAVFEHSRINVASTISPSASVRTNLWYYQRAAELASQQGADLILYPAYGIFQKWENRSEIRQYLEVVPNPKYVSVNPCVEEELFSDRLILRTLSCMARKNNIVVVAHMGSIEFCNEYEEACPEDGAWQFSANVAFDKSGKLTARYYNERLYYELGMDSPREEQDPVLNTDFGRFAMFIYYNIMFEKMAVTSRLPDVDAVLFSTMWFNVLPFFTSTQWFQAWSMGNDVTLLAASIQTPGSALAGSGIFGGRRGSVVHYLNPDNTPKLMVATLARRNRGNVDADAKVTALVRDRNEEVLPEGTNVTRDCSYKTLGIAKDIFNDFRCFNEKMGNYTMVRLSERVGRKQVCNNGLCCALEYEANSTDEGFYLGVYEGYGIAFSNGRYFWWEQNCFLARRDDGNNTACSHFPTTTDALFYKISLTADITADYVYPSFVSSRLRLVPVADWSFMQQYGSSTIELNSHRGVQIIAATLKGRAYDRDPPYVR